MNHNQLTVFEKIIERILPATIIYETTSIIVIKDINPQAPIHFLIIPKEKHINISDIQINKMQIAQEIFLTAQYLSHHIENAKEYKLIINNGEKAGQVVPHLHVHFLSGY
jgi:histidine triad (HIT) family protein